MPRPTKSPTARRSLRFRTLSRRHPQRGFTAIEIAMVATVIAILALIVLPLFRNRVEESKIAATKADLASLQKSLTLAQADTSFYPRLEDLDNTEGNPYSSATSQGPVGGISLETPPFYYEKIPAVQRQPLNLQEWRAFSGTQSSPRWKGPYASFQRSMTYEELKGSDIAPYVLRSFNPPYSTADVRQAPIWDVPQADSRGTNLYDSELNRIPIDPWGNPYLYFPATGETPYLNNVIYSLGPNGAPGDGTQSQVADYYLRRTPTGVTDETVLGTYDDIKVEF